MPKIKVEFEVPEVCWKQGYITPTICDHYVTHRMSFGLVEECTLFNKQIKGQERCRECIDSELKVSQDK